MYSTLSKRWGEKPIATKQNASSSSRCAVISPYIPAGAVAEFECHGMDGRYVNVVIPGREQYLTLCEVEVYGSVLD